MTKAVAIYTRISRDDLGDGAGVRRQEQDCRALCVRRGWSVATVLTDNDFSAFSGRRRPGYVTLLRLLESRDVDCVMAWAPERLHRSPRDLEDFLELIERTGASVETVKAGAWDVSSSHGRLVARMLGAVSRAESERTGERVSRAHQQAQELGRWRGAIPLGMRATATPGLPEPDPERAGLIEGVLDRIVRGDALTRIAADLNRDGMIPRRGKAWTHTGVQRLIASPALAGLVKVDDEFRPAAFTGVVDALAWHQAQAAIAARPRGEMRRPRETLTLLGGLLRCDEHEQVCFGGGTDAGRVYAAQAAGRCYVRIPRPPADDLMRKVVVARLRQPDARGLLRPADRPRGDVNEVASLRRRREEIADLVADGLLPVLVARSRLDDLARKLAALEPDYSSSPLKQADLADPAAAWQRWTITQRREVIRLLFADLRLAHCTKNIGPRVDVRRLNFVWAEAS